MATSWAIQVLTPDYLVDGLFDESLNTSTAMYYFKEWYDADGILAISASLHLTAVQFQPTRLMAGPSSPATDWWGFSYSLVALIPRDESSLAHVTKNFNPKVVIPADIYVGPYRIHGTILSPDRQLGALRYYFNFAVRDAEIECLETGAKFQGLKAPYAIVRTHLLQGITQST
jgi:hypothetical protein